MVTVTYDYVNMHLLTLVLHRDTLQPSLYIPDCHSLMP